MVLAACVEEEAEMALRVARRGLVGRGAWGEAARLLAGALDEAAEKLLDSSSRRLGHQARLVKVKGDVARGMLDLARGADLLVLARQGERDRAGPKSLGHLARFVVDHAPCDICLVWPKKPARGQMA